MPNIAIAKYFVEVAEFCLKIGLMYFGPVCAQKFLFVHISRAISIKLFVGITFQHDK